MKELLSIAVPITLGSAGLQIINLFDTMIYMRRLTGALQWTEKMADSAKGVYNFCQTVFALPCSFIPTITIAVIPAITASLTRKDLAEAKATSESSVRTMALIAMPCAAGLFVMAEPVIRLLCSSYTEDKIQLAATMLAILGLTVIFNSLVLLLNAIMQAHGDVVTPVVNMLIGGIIKIIVNYILVGQPNLNIVGADRHVHLLHLDHGARPDCYEAAHFRPSGNFQKHHTARSFLCNHGRSNIHGVPRSVERDLLVEACVPSEPCVCSGFVRGSGGLPAVSDV